MPEAQKNESEKILFGETVKMEKVPCVREILQAIEIRKDKETDYFPKILKC